MCHFNLPRFLFIQWLNKNVFDMFGTWKKNFKTTLPLCYTFSVCQRQFKLYTSSIVFMYTKELKSKDYPRKNMECLQFWNRLRSLQQDLNFKVICAVYKNTVFFFTTLAFTCSRKTIVVLFIPRPRLHPSVFSQEISTHSLLHDPDKGQETFCGTLSILLF